MGYDLETENVGLRRGGQTDNWAIKSTKSDIKF